MAYCGVILKIIVQGFTSWECIIDFPGDFDNEDLFEKETYMQEDFQFFHLNEKVLVKDAKGLV